VLQLLQLLQLPQLDHELDQHLWLWPQPQLLVLQQLVVPQLDPQVDPHVDPHVDPQVDPHVEQVSQQSWR
jgi:hypothetical protein